jgi:N-acetylglucosamine kinase-like BadF-type ATPase
LRQIAQSLDGRRGPTLLSNLFCETLGVTEPGSLVPAIYSRRSERTWISSLTPIVFTAAQRRDDAACRVLSEAADELGSMVAAVVRALELPRHNLPLALSGGVLVRGATLRAHVKQALQRREIPSAAMRVVKEPVVGAVKLARAELHGPTGRDARWFSEETG